MSTPSIKEHFTSRWGKEGVLIEVDWGQLEVCVFAFLTQDYILMDDIRSGKDIHKIMYSNCHGIPVEEVTSEQRKGIKACTFHVIYGGGARSMATRMGLDEEFCKQFIESFYNRYPTAKLWQDNLVHTVESNKKLNGKMTEGGKPQHEGYYKSITGRKYVFKTSDAPDFLQKKGIETGFNPPEIKNYPVQGFATADIHMLALGNLWRKSIYHRDKFLLINTIHDSVLIDCKKEFLDFTCKTVKDGLYLVTRTLKEDFNLDFNVPLKVDLKIGDSWANMNKYEV